MVCQDMTFQLFRRKLIIKDLKGSYKTAIFDKNMQLIGKGKADYLEQILHEIEPETYPCNHTKKLHDISDGQLYCMGCNQNL